MDEIIKWIDAETEKPDDSIDVLVFGNLEASDEISCVWPGYFDSEDDCWRCSGGNELEKVTHWADMPAGPKNDAQ